MHINLGEAASRFIISSENVVAMPSMVNIIVELEEAVSWPWYLGLLKDADNNGLASYVRRG